MNRKIFGDLDGFRQSGTTESFNIHAVWQQIEENTEIYLGNFFASDL